MSRFHAAYRFTSDDDDGHALENLHHHKGVVMWGIMQRCMMGKCGRFSFVET